MEQEKMVSTYNRKRMFWRFDENTEAAEQHLRPRGVVPRKNSQEFREKQIRAESLNGTRIPRK